MNRYWIAAIFALCLTSCGLLPSAATKTTPLTLTDIDSKVPLTQTATDNLSANPPSAINTLDVSEITPPPADTNPFVKLAEDDLAKRLNINTDQLQFLKISEIDWQDIQQGCTIKAGQTLTKGRVSGYRIWLAANGQNYAYHVGMDNTVLLCTES